MKRLFILLALIVLSVPTHTGRASAPADNESAPASPWSTPVVAAQSELPDLYLGAPGQPRIVVGGELGGKGGKAAIPGQTLQLTKADSRGEASGKLIFHVTFYIRNDKKGKAANFTTRLSSGKELLSETKNLTFNGSSFYLVKTRWAASPGTHYLRVSLDDDKVVAESDESNNFHVFKVVVSDN